MEVVYHGGGAASYKEKFKTQYSLTKECPGGHKNLDYWIKYGPDTNCIDCVRFETQYTWKVKKWYK